MNILNICRRGTAIVASTIVLTTTAAQAQTETLLEPVVVSATRSEQKLFDASASVSSVQIDPHATASPLVNLSELLSTAPGVLLRERQNYAQDLQLSIRGFGTRSTFGVRGVRILVDGIPATLPDGQGQAATAPSLRLDALKSCADLWPSYTAMPPAAWCRCLPPIRRWLPMLPAPMPRSVSAAMASNRRR